MLLAGELAESEGSGEVVGVDVVAFASKVETYMR